MATKKIKVGDAALVHGRMLAVTAVEDVVAELSDVTGEKFRAAAKVKLAEIRAEQLALDHNDRLAWLECATRVEAIDKEAKAVLFRLKLRKDLLTWWKERECWVSEGRILSDVDLKRAKKELGGVRPEGHKTVYNLYHPMGA